MSPDVLWFETFDGLGQHRFHRLADLLGGNHAGVPARQHQKINRIYTGLNGRFSMGKIKLRENMFDLINEILTFGPSMAHDDTIEALYYALQNAYPPDLLFNKDERRFESRRPRVKSWITS